MILVEMDIPGYFVKNAWYLMDIPNQGYLNVVSAEKAI